MTDFFTTYALRIRIGYQHVLLTPALARLCASLEQLSGARLIGVRRGPGYAVHELIVLVGMPDWTINRARTWLITWAENNIDTLNHAHPYVVPQLLANGGADQQQSPIPFVHCEPMGQDTWLRQQNLTEVTSCAIVLTTPFLQDLLRYDSARLKTVIPIAILASLDGVDMSDRVALFSAVFLVTTNDETIKKLLENQSHLESQGRLVRRTSLPNGDHALFEHLLAVIKTGLAGRVELGASIEVARLLLNQLGFSGYESDYLILLAMPAHSINLLHQEWEQYDEV